jgi:hypothetical protein
MATRPRPRDLEDFPLEETNPGPSRRSSFATQVDEVNKCFTQTREALLTHEDRIHPILRHDPNLDAEFAEKTAPEREERRESSYVIEALEQLHQEAHEIYETVIALTARVDI